MKTPKVMQVKIDGVVYTSTVAPETMDDMDGCCPACGSNQYHEIMTLIQHGFIVDDCISLLTCDKCYETFHYLYTIQTSGLVY